MGHRESVRLDYPEATCQRLCNNTFHIWEHDPMHMTKEQGNKHISEGTSSGMAWARADKIIQNRKLLAKVADKLKDRVLFPEQLARVKEYLKNVK